MQVVVVGSGIFGVTGALELQRRGHAVRLVDPGPLPHPQAASTDISKVIRMDYGADEFYMALMEEALEGWEGWNREWPERLYHPDGFLIMSRSEMRPGSFEYESYQLLVKRGHQPQRLDAARLRQRFPAWNAERYPDGYFNPKAGWAESGKVVARLIHQARAEGVEVREGVRFERLVESGGRVSGIVARGGETIGADWVIVAAGAWTPTLLPHLAEAMWAIGQPVLHFRPDHPDDFRTPYFVPWAADIATTGWYGFPAMPDGTLKAANHGPGVRVHPDAPRLVPPEAEARFRAFFHETFPALAEAPLIGSRLCLYCDTWDGNFWIDRDPDRPGLVVAAGGSGHGFKFAPVLGGIIADVVEGKPNPWAGRFAWRSRGSLATEDARYAGHR